MNTSSVQRFSPVSRLYSVRSAPLNPVYTIHPYVRCTTDCTTGYYRVYAASHSQLMAMCTAELLLQHLVTVTPPKLRYYCKEHLRNYED